MPPSASARKDGMSHIPEDRHKHGLVLDYSLENNIVLQRYWQPEFQKNGFIRSDEGAGVFRPAHRAVRRAQRSGTLPPSCAACPAATSRRPSSPARSTKTPSCWWLCSPPVAWTSAPSNTSTSQIVAQRDEGKAVLLVSLELDEVMNLSDRILVMYEGEVVGEFDPKTTTVQELGLYMAGARKQGKESN